LLSEDASPDSWNVITPEPAAAEKTEPKAKTVHCTAVKPNKVRVFHKPRRQRVWQGASRRANIFNINRLLLLTLGFSPVWATTDTEPVSTVFAAEESR